MQRGAPSGDCRAGQLSIPGASWHSPPTTGVTRLAGTVYHLETVEQDSYPYLEHPGTLLLLQESQG